jgi:hypothetical protein
MNGMKRLKVLMLWCGAAALIAGCALPLGEDYLLTRDGNAGIIYITDYNLQTYVPIPKAGERPVSIVNNRGDLEVEVTWKDQGGIDIPRPFDTFQTNTVYRAEIKLTPKSGYGFYPAVPFGYPDGKTTFQNDDLGDPARTVMVTYNNSDDADITFITNYNLQSYVPIPLAGDKPVRSVTSRGDLAVTVDWEVKDPSNSYMFVPFPAPIVPAADRFDAGAVYRATIGLTAQTDYCFITTRDFEYPSGTVTTPPGTDAGITVRNLTVTYIATRIPTIINDLNLTTYIPKPLSGIMPVISFAGSQYTGTVSWKNSGTQAALVGPFQPDTEYTAEVTLTPALGHSFTGVGQDTFIHTGAGSVTNPADGDRVRISFSPTASAGGLTVVYDTNLTGRLPRPISGETPVLGITGTQYTGTVTWLPAPHSTFQYGTVYTAEITLNAVPGYTFTGIRQNVFTHGAAPGGVSNQAGSGTVRIVFPATASSTYSVITSFGPVEAEHSALKLMKEKKDDNTVTIDLSGGIEPVIPTNMPLVAGNNSPAKVIINGRGRILRIQALGTLLTVGGGVTLTLRDITLWGMNGNNAPLITVAHGGKLILGAGAVLTENQSTGNAGGVWVNGGELVLNNGGIIEKMSAQQGGGVLVDGGGKFVMNGGTIGGGLLEGNTVSGVNGGGGVLVADGSFSMLDGIVQSNHAQAGGSGGGVLVAAGSFDMIGGIIQSNNAAADGSGGGVGILNGGTFTLYNGTIRANEALGPGGSANPESGGAVYLAGDPNNWGTFTMYGGTIGGDNPEDANTAIIGANGVCSIFGKFIMSGGIIKGNRAAGTSNYGVYAHNPYNYFYSYDHTSPFTMTGSAQVAEDNQVFLSSYATITIGGALSALPAADIMVNSPSDGTRLLQASSSSLITENFTKFLYAGSPGHIKNTPTGSGSTWYGVYQ